MYKLRDGDGVRFAELVDRVTRYDDTQQSTNTAPTAWPHKEEFSPSQCARHTVTPALCLKCEFALRRRTRRTFQTTCCT